MDRREPPDFVIRSHVHWFESSGEKNPPSMIYCPAWQLSTAFGHNALGVGGWQEPVGGLWFKCDGGRAEWDVIRFKERDGDATSRTAI